MNNSRGSQWLSAGSIAALARNGGQTCRGGRAREGSAQGWGSAINPGKGLSQRRAALRPAAASPCPTAAPPARPNLPEHPRPPVPRHAGVLGWGRYRRARARCPLSLPRCFAPASLLLSSAPSRARRGSGRHWGRENPLLWSFCWSQPCCRIPDVLQVLGTHCP